MRRTVLVTGCTAGSTGHAIAKEYHARGLHVFATARRLESMSDLANIPNMTLLALDITSHASIKAAVASVKTELGEGVGLDLLVNNAGVASTTPALDHTLEDIRAMFEANVFGMMSMVQEFMPLLALSKDACIVNVGSNAAYVPLAFGSTYNASKAAVHAYSDTLRVELRPLNIKVVTVVLGGVKSNIFGYPAKPLPENSYYTQIESLFRTTRRDMGKRAMPPNQLAHRFVNATLRASPARRLHVGAGATFIPVIAFLFPRALMEFLIYKVLSLDKLAAYFQKANKAK